MKARFLFLVPLFASCSVMIASHREGVGLDQVQAARTREQFLDLAGGDPISSETALTGERIETYQILQEKGSTARALMHGLLDLSTAFLWEFAGTPIESALSQKKYFLVKVHYAPDGEIAKVELYN
jgi:hypothetical protein